MLEELTIELLKSRENLRLKQKLKYLAEHTRSTLERMQERKLDLEVDLEKEGNDVKKLESVSVSNLFYSIIGRKDDKLEKEKHELFAVKLEYDDCCKSIASLEKELEEHTHSLDLLWDAENQYELALQHKKEFILGLDDINSFKLLRLLDTQVALESQIKELQEAISAGVKAQQALYPVLDSLKSAENWGIWDNFGGGIIAGVTKHSELDSAREYALSAKHALIGFQNELKDVKISMNFNISIVYFDRFADIFFDSHWTDRLVQRGIESSYDRIYQTSQDVYRVTESMKDELMRVKGRLAKIENNIQEYIEET